MVNIIPAGIARINSISYLSVSLDTKRYPIPLYINIQIQKKLIMARARSENGAVPVIVASHGARSNIKIEIKMKKMPKNNHTFFHVFSEIIISSSNGSAHEAWNLFDKSIV
jgi:hypothetical protein